MLHRLCLFLGVCATLSLGFPDQADATYLTSNGTVEMQTPFPAAGQTGANPPLEHITQFGLGSGRLFTNQVGGTPFEVGRTVRTVGTISITQAINGDNVPALLPDGTPAQFIFAVEGTIVPPVGGAAASARFHGGSLWAVSRVTGNPVSFNRDDPLTWNFDDVFAKFDLLPPGDIIDGSPSGAAVSAPAGSVNLSSVGTVAGAVDGIFVFGEDLAFAPAPGFSNPGLGSNVGSEWLRDVENAIFGEGLAAFTDQTVNSTPIALTPDQIAMLDAISLAASGFTGPFSEGGYTPSGTGSTGDFNADLSAEAYVIGVVPEPTSLALFGLGAGVLAFSGRRRRGRTDGTQV